MNNKEQKEEKESNDINKKSEIIEEDKEKIESQEEKEEEFTLNEYLNLLDKEILFISKIEKNEHEELKKCTYDKGYSTQEVYVCLTCAKEKNTTSGICLGCAFKCHIDHEVENLHFKRNFRCDCGNSNFFTSCELEQEKEFKNDNYYNHNFSLRYCHCDKEEGDEMLQCALCEDWFHTDCLNFNDKFDSKNDNDNSTLICKKCLKDKLNFIRFYPKFEKVLVEDKKKKIDIISENYLGKLKNDQKNLNLDKEEIGENLLRKKRKHTLHDSKANSELINEDIKIDNKIEIEKQNEIDQNEEFDEPFNINIINVLPLNEYSENNQQEFEIKKLKEEITDTICSLTNKNTRLDQDLENYSDNLQNLVFDRELDVIVDINSLFNILCKCKNCLLEYENLGIGFISSKKQFVEDWLNRQLFEDKALDDANQDNEKNREILNEINSVNLNNLPKIRDMPIENQILMNQGINQFQSFFSSYILRNPPQENLITQEYIKKLLDEFMPKNTKN